MIELDLQTGLYLLAAVVGGVIVGWFVRSWSSKRSLNQAGDQWQEQFNKANQKNASLEASVKEYQAAMHDQTQAAAKTQAQIESLVEKVNTLSRKVLAVAAERDELKEKLAKVMALVSAGRQHMDDQNTEMARVSEFYKGQLESANEQRTSLEGKTAHDKAENESLRNLLMSAKSEHESVSKLLTTAQSRLETLDDMEQKVISLEAKNAELQQAAVQVDALKVQNRELTRSRKQYETDANRYRNQYEKSEKESDTLRFKLGDIESEWVEMRRMEDEAREADPTLDPEPPPLGLDAPQGEPDDLQEIVGIGKVFEATLNDLGVYHYRQIAAFGPAEIARINAELQEFKGRIEHDDWIGQAKELHFKKYEDVAE